MSLVLFNEVVMKIYTSYFAQLRNFPSNLVGVSTAMWQPKYINPGRDKNGAYWFVCPPLQPGEECAGLCNGKCAPKHPNDCKFLQTYRKQLDRLDFRAIIARFSSIAEKIKKEERFNDVDFAILVYEAPNNLCSERGPIQAWFRDNGMEIEEWTKEHLVSLPCDNK